MKDFKNKVIFLSLFLFLAFISLQIPFSKLAGSNISFTLFDFFTPLAGAFLGPLMGISTVLIVELINFFIKQTPVSPASIIRLFPMLFACWYFASVNKKGFSAKLTVVVPLICIAVFLAHPVGRSVWYYSLFWLIPVFAYLKSDWLPIRSLGATFTAHAVGGAAWIWALNLPAAVWNSLIPLVIVERILFAIGIAVSFVITKQVILFLVSKKLLPKITVLNSTN